MTTEPAELVRALYDSVTIDGRIDLVGWVEFKNKHGVEPQQTEPVLVEVLGHVLTLAGELQREMDRLSVALQRRG